MGSGSDGGYRFVFKFAKRGLESWKLGRFLIFGEKGVSGPFS